jgi:UDP-N-acetyl-D-glucosamine/UDP-N-acetyl-D-galactosamine dehydrogenase
VTGLTRKVSIVGLGYAGLPLALEFGKFQAVIAYDSDASRIEELKTAQDRNGIFDSNSLSAANIFYTHDANDLKKTNFYIVVVPTPITVNNEPDLQPLFAATKTLGALIKKGDIVVFQSTVYPGLTEEECIPLLQRLSGLKCGTDFAVGYSPERLNQGDNFHDIANTKRVIASQDAKSLVIIASVYGAVVKVGIEEAPSIRVAEAAKLIENIQRDVNIALMNEIAIVLNKLDINTNDVIKTASSKWNFHQFSPGLVGGHCISVDPYYFIHKARTAGCTTKLIAESRIVNDAMPNYIGQQIIRRLNKLGIKSNASAIFLGLTYKENCADMRNSRAYELFLELQRYGLSMVVNDSIASPAAIKRKLNLDIIDMDDLPDAEILVIAVAHNEYKQLSTKQIIKKFPSLKLIVDVKSILDDQAFIAHGIDVWRL